MCGRYSLGKKPRAWPEESQTFLPRFNIAPTQQAPVFLSDGSLQMMRWGLVTAWSKDRTDAYKMINARAETVATKPAFRSALKERRCAVPADSFYEWRKQPGRRQPVRFLLQDREPFFLAGLWEQVVDNGTPLRTFTIITTQANDLVRPLHDRMPVILSEASAAEWLKKADIGLERLPALLCPFPASAMSSYSVSTRLNDALWDHPDCILPAVDSNPLLPGLDR